MSTKISISTDRADDMEEILTALWPIVRRRGLRMKKKPKRGGKRFAAYIESRPNGKI